MRPFTNRVFMNNEKAIQQFQVDWQNRGYEKGESQQFWLDLLANVFGIQDLAHFIQFENQVHLDHTSFIDGYIPSTKVLIEQKGREKDLNKPIQQSDGSYLTAFQQAKRYAAELPYSQRPRWIVTCNFRSWCIYDMEQPNSEPQTVLLENLHKESYRLQFLVRQENIHLNREMEMSMKAGEIIGHIYDKLLALYINPDAPETLHSLNMLCVRLVFCLYAEDAGIFGRKQLFGDYISQFPAKQIRQALLALFEVLDTPIDKRDPYLDEDLKAFPYVNGGLFTVQDKQIPQFTDELKQMIVRQASDDFDWSEISPTIFGAIFESTLNPETRRAGGMHYTSIENIHKVIDPLFLNDLTAELEQLLALPIKQQKTALVAYQKRLASLRFLDPACGSGNFLTETFISLRRLENRCLQALQKNQITLDFFGDRAQVSIQQFYGIEINDFAATVAKTALWIAESQMLHETCRILQRDIDFLPLQSYSNIVEGNALQIDWATLSNSAVATPNPSKGGESPSPLGRVGERPKSPSPLERAGERPETSLYPRYYTAEYKQWKILKEFARDNRKNSTEAEKLLWQVLRNKQLGVQFRRQHAIDIFIADFICIACKLIVEVDGDYHNTPEQEEYDQQRTYMLENLGYKILRFTNDEIINNIGQVVSTIKKAIAEANNAVATPTPSEGGENLEVVGDGVATPNPSKGGESPSPLGRVGERPKSPSPLERAGVRPERAMVRPATSLSFGEGRGEAKNEAIPYNYIMGNPPFVGYSLQSKEQKEQMLAIYVDEKGKPYKTAGKIDYVAAWYYKAAQLIQNTQVRCAFVSTNSITQGEQVAAVWKPLMDMFHIHIDFAYRTFRWDSEANLKAHVHCVIVGFSDAESNKKPFIFDESGAKKTVEHINPYLIGAKDVWIESRTNAICHIPQMVYGSKPVDGGYFFLTEQEKDTVLQAEPNIAKFIRQIYGADEFINNKKRYVFWLVDASPADIKNSPTLFNCVQAVRKYRLQSTKAATRQSADWAHLFQEVRFSDTDYIIVPRVSSEKRRYIPIGFCSADIVASDAVQIIPNATLYHFGVLTSNVHMAWMRVVCGRLKSDYRYSKDIVYNNFPWPTPTEEQQAEIMRTAQAILTARAQYLSPSPLERVGVRPLSPSPLERVGVRPLSPSLSERAEERPEPPSPLERVGVRPEPPSPLERVGVRPEPPSPSERVGERPEPPSPLERAGERPERPCSLADLYDEVTMPIDLRRAHQANDRAVMRAYGFPTTLSESDCVARLFERYEKIVRNEE